MQSVIVVEVLHLQVVGVDRQDIHLRVDPVQLLVVLKRANLRQNSPRRSLQLLMVQNHHCQPANTSILLGVSVGHVCLGPVNWTCEQTG